MPIYGMEGLNRAERGRAGSPVGAQPEGLGRPGKGLSTGEVPGTAAKRAGREAGSKYGVCAGFRYLVPSREGYPRGLGTVVPYGTWAPKYLGTVQVPGRLGYCTYRTRVYRAVPGCTGTASNADGHGSL